MSNTINYDVNSHIFQTKIRNGSIDPLTDIIIYDGGNLDEENVEEENEGEE